MRDAREKQDGRDSKFEVPSTSNFGPRIVVCLAFPPVSRGDLAGQGMAEEVDLW